MPKKKEIAHQQVEQLLNFIDASPSPWHAVESIKQWLVGFQFQPLLETDKWSLDIGGRYFVIRDDSSIIAFVVGNKSIAESAYKIVGAHTDSPGLRVKPNAAHIMDGWLRLGVEVYGGPILATFSDRDLSLAGRISYKQNDGTLASTLLRFDSPLLRLPNLAIHMNRNVNDDGLKFQKQTELPLLLKTAIMEQLPKDYFYTLLEQPTGIPKEQILGYEFNVYDTQKGAFWGADQAFYANSQLDNLASCHASLSALLDESVLSSESTLVVAFFDHEEIGSCSSKGAEGSFLPDVLERIALATHVGREDYQRALARSFLVSADMAHAYQPNFPQAYDSEHKVMVNSGPVIKVNANHRYASESTSVAMFARWCEIADVPYQVYSHRTDLPCGSTIGPITSAKLGLR
ncbi:MAG: M18 family aminopeptidase, partial [Methylococcales bacterium]|nr:M18 family aminopeptidase [Methylococcales bacterium]